MSGTTRLSPTASAMMRAGQSAYLQQGGPYQVALATLRSEGLMDTEYVFREYPKVLYIPRGKKVVKRKAVDIDKKVIEWEEERDAFDEITVSSEEEEERVLNGGKTAEQIEDERQSLILQAKQKGIRFDPAWSMLRLQRELGVSVAQEVSTGYDEIDELKKQVAKAEEAIALRARLRSLNEELNGPVPVLDDVEVMRAQLASLGVHVDGRWNAARLRKELDAATAPDDEAA